MKSLITILALIFALFNIVASNAFGSQAQDQPQNNPFPEMSKQKEQYPSGFEYINDIENGALRVRKKGDKDQGNSNYRIESVKVYSRDSLVKNYTYTYNDSKQILIETIDKWENDGWVNANRSTYTYDENGNQLNYLYEKWANSVWINLREVTNTYDQRGILLTSHRKEWVIDQWVSLWKSFYIYDESDSLITMLSKKTSNSEWINNYKSTYTYDENGNRIIYLFENWNNDKWVNITRTTYTYDEGGNLLTENFMVGSNDEWVNNSKYTYTYDEDGNLLTKLYERWLFDKYVNNSKYTYTYDEDGSLLMFFKEKSENNTWINDKRSTYAYNIDGNLNTFLSEKWKNEQWSEDDGFLSFDDFNSNIFGRYKGYRIEITWAVFTSVGNEYDYNFSINASPNPFNQFTIINYELRKSGNVTMSIYDNLGSKITTLVNEYQTEGNHIAVFDAAGRPAGMYYYTIRIEERVENGKLLLIR